LRSGETIPESVRTHFFSFTWYGYQLYCTESHLDNQRSNRNFLTIETKPVENTFVYNNVSYTYVPNTVKPYIIEGDPAGIAPGNYQIGAKATFDIGHSGIEKEYILEWSDSITVLKKDIHNDDNYIMSSDSNNRVGVSKYGQTSYQTTWGPDTTVFSLSIEDYSDSKDLDLYHQYGNSGGSGTQYSKKLVRGQDYTVSVEAGSDDVPKADGSSKYTLKVDGIGDNYTGTGKISFTLAKPAVTYNGSSEYRGPYVDGVEIKSLLPGYQVSLTNSNYADSIYYQDTEHPNFTLYMKKTGSDRPFKVELTGVELGKRSLADCDISADKDYGKADLYTLTYTKDSTTYTLQAGTDYDYKITDSQGNDCTNLPLEIGKSYTIKYTAIESGSYTGTKTQDAVQIELPSGQKVLYDGGEKTASYLDKVTLSFSDNAYKVSNSPDGPFSDSFDYDDITSTDVNLYLKKGDSGRVLLVPLQGVVVERRQMSDADVSSTPDYAKNELFTLTYTKGTETSTLKPGDDYTYVINDESGKDCTNEPLIVGNKYQVVFTGTEKVRGYEGTTASLMFTVPGFATFNGAAMASPYEYSVIIAGKTPGDDALSVGYTKSSLAESVVRYAQEEDNAFDLYFQKSGSSSNRFYKQSITGLVVNKVSMTSDKIAITLDTDQYLASPQYEIKYNNTYTLVKDTDFTAFLTVPENDSIPVADGQDGTNTITFTGNGNFTGAVTKNVKITPLTITFNDAAINSTKTYYGSVSLKGPEGFGVSLSGEGPFGESVDYKTEGENQTFYLYLKNNNGVIVKQKIENLTIQPPPYKFDDFFTNGGPKAAQDLVYNREKQSLLVNWEKPEVPKNVKDDETVTVESYSEADSFNHTDAGSYNDVTYTITYTYKKYSNSNKTGTPTVDEKVTVEKNYGTITIAGKDINDLVLKSSALVLTPSGNYDYATSNVDFKVNAFTFKFGDYILKDTDYVIMDAINPLPDPGTAVNVGEHYDLNFAGKGNYTGELKNTIEVASVDGITYNGSEKLSEKYYDQVKIGAPAGYSISLSEEGFAESVVYDTIGSKQTVTVYLKNRTTGRIVIQKLTGITISALQVLYDGKPVIAESYYESVRISADGFEVSNSKDGTYSNYYTCTKAGKVPDFTLYFRDKSSDYVKEVTISGLVIRKDIDLPVKYNGGKYKEWFNTDVEITCENDDESVKYRISPAGKNKFEDSYTVTKDGVNEIELDFKNVKDSTDIQTFTLIIRIDRDDPKASIAIGDYKSSSFKEYDTTALSTNKALEVTITPSKTASAIDYILYTTAEKFYERPGDLLKDIPENSAYWSTYDGDNKPQIKKNKRHYYYAIIYDNAGNRTFLSTGAVIYDTKAPEMVSGPTTESEDGKSFTVKPTGKDSLSGVNRFMLMYKEKTSDDMKKPEKDVMLSKGIEIKASEGDDGIFTGKYTAKGIKANKEYMVYLMAVDEAGNAGSVTQKSLRSHSRIEIDNYISTEFKTSDTLAMYSQEAKKASIISENAKSIKFYVSDTYYKTPNEVNSAIKQKSLEWNEYSSMYKPEIVKDRKNYIYALIENDDGSIKYLSTGNIIYDTVAPEMTSNKVDEASDSKSFTVTAKGEDDLSGVYRFMLMYKEITSDDMENPEKDEMLKKGIAIKASKDEDGTYSGKYTAKNLDPDKNYMIYLMAVDNAGNTSKITQKSLRTDARIKIDDYVSTRFQTTDKIIAYSKNSKKATITASDAESIKFYVSDTYYATPEDVRTAIMEKDSDWKKYSSDYKPETVKDQKNYFYAYITDKDGSEIFLSTGAFIYDTIAPKMSIATVTPSDSGEGSTIATGGTDELSGIGSFKYKYFVVEEGVTPTKPTKEDLFDNGTVIDVSKSAETAAMGTATITGLSPDNKYDFYFVAVDKAKNVSEVFYTQIDGKDAVPGGAAAGGSGSKANAGSEGLTPAPNGIAGSGDKQKSDKSSTGTGQKETKPETTGESSAPINRDPYIADATGNTRIGLAQTGGWTKISGEVKQADKGAVIEVEMSGTSNVSRQLFDAMNTKDVSVKLRMPNNVQWEIKGDAINQNNIADRDMGVKIGSRNIPDQHLNDVVGSNPHIEFSMTSKENPGFEATITIPADQTNAGMNATLYKYDAETKEMTMVGTALVDDNGNVQFPITDFADYTVVISPEKALLATETAVSEGVIEDEDLTRGGMIRLTDIFGQRGGAPIWLFVIAIISAGLCIAILYMPTFQAKDDDDFSNFA
jgi:hypothetical protein